MNWALAPPFIDQGGAQGYKAYVLYDVVALMLIKLPGLWRRGLGRRCMHRSWLSRVLYRRWRRPVAMLQKVIGVTFVTVWVSFEGSEACPLRPDLGLICPQRLEEVPFVT